MLKSAFFRENFVTVLGIVLPLLLVAVFALARGVSETAVPPPQFKAVYAQSVYPYGGKFVYSVNAEKKLVVIFEGARTSGNPEPKPQPITTTIYVSDGRGGVTKHNYTVANAYAPGVTNVDTTDLDVTIAAQGTTAPDGYVYVDYRDHNYSGGILPEIFGYNGRYNSERMIAKAGRSFPLESGNAYDPFEFIGWAKE